MLEYSVSNKNNYKFFENRACKYYPCHKGVEEINCLFCYCPLYYMDDCGGNYTFTRKGIKDCSACILPHKRENYDYVNEKIAVFLKEYLKQKHHGKRGKKK